MNNFGKINYLGSNLIYMLIICTLIFSLSCTRFGVIFLTSVPEIADSLPILNIDKSEYIETVNYHDVTMFHYFDGNCSSCITDLKIRSHYIDSVFKNDIGLVFIAYAKDTVILNYYLIDRYKFKLPVLYDEKSQFYQWNKQYIDKGVVTFLVNHNGRILITGDPVADKEIEKEYFKILTTN